MTHSIIWVSWLQSFYLALWSVCYENGRTKCFSTRVNKKDQHDRCCAHNNLFFLFQFSMRQLKFVSSMQNTNIQPNRKIYIWHLAPENAETPWWWRLLMANGKKSRLQQFSGHFRLHLFVTDQEFPLPAVAPSRVVAELLERMAWGVANYYQSDKTPVQTSSCRHSRFGKWNGVLCEQFSLAADLRNSLSA